MATPDRLQPKRRVERVESLLRSGADHLVAAPARTIAPKDCQLLIADWKRRRKPFRFCNRQSKIVNRQFFG